jgi:hypothetical protein
MVESEALMVSGWRTVRHARPYGLLPVMLCHEMQALVAVDRMVALVMAAEATAETVCCTPLRCSAALLMPVYVVARCCTGGGGDGNGGGGGDGGGGDGALQLQPCNDSQTSTCQPMAAHPLHGSRVVQAVVAGATAAVGTGVAVAATVAGVGEIDRSGALLRCALLRALSTAQFIPSGRPGRAAHLPVPG